MSKKKNSKQKDVQVRPQPAGWETSMKVLLKPEHVERVSDTEVRMTLPECADYDIDEDEVVHVTIPASALTKPTESVYAGAFTIKADTFEERIDNAIKGLGEETQGHNDGAAVANFILTFFTCEIVAKSIVSICKYKGTGRKTLASKWSTKDINNALKELSIGINESIVTALFAENKRVVASEMSARALRDSIAHRMKSVHRKAVKRRYDDLMQNMQEFLGAIEKWRSLAKED
jgi:hypothetical protein